ncbi:MAG: tyrosine-type recombinase/integrase [Hyphomicrobiales bacterium]|nr:tyrosine-type recombinase/integrase [Hyphomicrobiales bacterium]
MPLAMARPTRRSDTSLIYFRQRIPRDVLMRARGKTLAIPVGDETVSVVISETAETLKLSLRTRDPAEARKRHAAVLGHLEQFWLGLRQGPRRLTRKEITALAGLFYRDLVDDLSDEPGPTAVWDHVLRLQKQAAEAGMLEDWAGPSVDDLLTRHALIVDGDTRSELLKEFHRTFTQAAEALRRKSDGDYREDPDGDRFPEWRRPDTPKAIHSITLTELIEAWWAESSVLGLAVKTHDSYASTFKKFSAFLGHDDASRVTPEDVIRYKDHRLASGLKAKTIKDVDLAALKSVFGWAVENRKLTANPATGVKLRIPTAQKIKNRGFTDDEAKAILKAAWERSPGTERITTAAAYRWVPWLCAYTGARVGEMVQLRRQDLVKREDVWFIDILPEAGTVKGGKSRSVPLHPHLVELGFPDFVATSSTEYLFVKPSPDGSVRGPVQGIKNRLASSARSIVSDKSVQPNHGWRHRMVTLGRKHGMDQEIRRMITGHSGQGVDESVYGEPAGLYREICKLPRYEVG